MKINKNDQTEMKKRYSIEYTRQYIYLEEPSSPTEICNGRIEPETLTDINTVG